jgi:uncharacterized protein HemX
MEPDSNLDNKNPKPEESAPRPSIDDFITKPHQQPGVSDEKDDSPMQHDNHPGGVFPQNAKKEKAGKGSKVWLIIFAILFIASAGAAGYYYMKYSDTNTQLNSFKQENTNQAAQITELLEDSEASTTLQETVDSQKAFIDSLTAVANELKTTCGADCDSITIPTYSETSE